MFLSCNFYNFRNLENAAIDLSSNEVFFVGKNAQGKTNLLEALYIASYGGSFRTSRDVELVKNGEKEFSICAFSKDDEKTARVKVIFDGQRKIIEKNGKKIRDRKELLEISPCVLFSHEDLRFATGNASDLRFYIDQFISQCDFEYLYALRSYKKALKNRNLILKTQNYNALDVYTKTLSHFGEILSSKRRAAAMVINSSFSSLYEQISGVEGVELCYKSSWEKGEGESKLSANIEKDKILCRTTSGPHLDRLFFVKKGELFAPFASMGQNRLLALLLRVEQSLYFTSRMQKRPILLMDDVLLELDGEKRQKLLSLLPPYEQLFATFLPDEPGLLLLDKNEIYRSDFTKAYRIEGGGWVDER